MVFKIAFVLFIKPQSYCTSKEFAFKDQKNKKMERKPGACTKDWILGSFFMSSLQQACTARAQPSRLVVQVNDSGVERIKECGQKEKTLTLLTPKQGLLLHLLANFHFNDTFSQLTSHNYLLLILGFLNV